jgi:hypothetical protein
VTDAEMNAHVDAGMCRCGHPPGHHDDEPAGCWECDCEAWHGSRTDWLERLSVEQHERGTCGCNGTHPSGWLCNALQGPWPEGLLEFCTTSWIDHDKLSPEARRWKWR